MVQTTYMSPKNFGSHDINNIVYYLTLSVNPSSMFSCCRSFKAAPAFFPRTLSSLCLSCTTSIGISTCPLSPSSAYRKCWNNNISCILADNIRILCIRNTWHCTCSCSTLPKLVYGCTIVCWGPGPGVAERRLSSILSQSREWWH